MRIACVLASTLLVSFAAQAFPRAHPTFDSAHEDKDDAWPASVTPLDVGAVGDHVQIIGSLVRGELIPDVRLPPSCVRDVDKDLLNGKHVLYAASLPPKGDMTITLLPRGESSLTIYAYLLPADRHDLPNDAESVDTCKSSSRSGVRNERLLKLTGGSETQNVVIGVTTGGESGTGKFLLTVDVR